MSARYLPVLAGQTSCRARNATTTTLTSSANPARLSEQITFRASVTDPAATPDGIVTFLDGATMLGAANLADGVATFTTASLAAGTHSITARYEGGVCCFGGSSAPLTQVVRPASSTALTVAPSSSVFGQSATLNAAAQDFFNAKGGKIGIWTAAPNAFFDDFGGGTAAP
jgi:hypothetical protein